MSESWMVGFSTGIFYHSCTNLPRNPCELGIVYFKLLSWHLKHSRENQHQKEMGDKINWEKAGLWFCCSFNVMNLKNSPVQPHSFSNICFFIHILTLTRHFHGQKADVHQFQCILFKFMWQIHDSSHTVKKKQKTGTCGCHNFTVSNITVKGYKYC